MKKIFLLEVRDHVMIAHSLPDPFFGPAQGMHGATYAIEAELAVSQLSSHDVVMDIGAFQNLLGEVLRPINYCNLDEHPAFSDQFSTTERVCEYVAEQLATRIIHQTNNSPVSLKITARESPVASAACTLTF